MFVPASFRPDEEEWITRLLRDHPLATLTSNGPEVPYSTQLPAIAESPEPIRPGSTVLGHMNRANPHWSGFEEGTPSVLVFNGPNGYVTPASYQTVPAAPTWNFATVHLQGTMSPLGDLDDVIHVVRRTVEVLEPRFGVGWDPEPSLEYFHRIGGGVGAFRFTVTTVDAQFKLSQDKDTAVRERVARRFAESESGTQRDLGALMFEYYRSEGPHQEAVFDPRPSREGS